MTLTVLVAWKGEDWKELAGIVLPNLAEYCARHGYSLQVHHGPYGDPTWAYPMQKTAWVRDVVTQEKSNWYWVLDIDLIVTNMRTPVLDFVDDTYDIFITRDTDWLNSGSYIIRGFSIARSWLNDIIAMRERSTSEQDAIHQLRPLYDKFTNVLPHPSINSIGYSHYPELAGKVTREQGDWREGDLVFHLPGKTPQERVTLLREYQGKVVR